MNLYNDERVKQFLKIYNENGGQWLPKDKNNIMKEGLTKWFTTAIENSRNLFKELESKIPALEVEVKVSSLDEGIITDKTIEGFISKETYYLKASENGKKFNYTHEITDSDDIDFIRINAFKQFEAWKETKKLEKQELETTN
jgi:hypothetical protein